MALLSNIKSGISNLANKAKTAVKNFTGGVVQRASQPAQIPGTQFSTPKPVTQAKNALSNFASGVAQRVTNNPVTNANGKATQKLGGLTIGALPTQSTQPKTNISNGVFVPPGGATPNRSTGAIGGTNTPLSQTSTGQSVSPNLPDYVPSSSRVSGGADFSGIAGIPTAQAATGMPAPNEEAPGALPVQQAEIAKKQAKTTGDAFKSGLSAMKEGNVPVPPTSAAGRAATEAAVGEIGAQQQAEAGATPPPGGQAFFDGLSMGQDEGFNAIKALQDEWESQKPTSLLENYQQLIQSSLNLFLDYLLAFCLLLI